MPANHSVRHASREAYKKLGHLGVLSSQCGQVLKEVHDALGEGSRNITRNELLVRLQRAYPMGNWHEGKLSARVKWLIDRGQLVSSVHERQCTVSKSGRPAVPVELPPEQRGLQ